MNIDRLEFTVVGLVDGYQRTVIGRCGDEPISLGDTFDAIYWFHPRKYPDELALAPVREQETPVRLCVVQIHAYNRSLPMLGQGMTGSLVLEGEGFQHVAPGAILGRRSAVGSRSTTGSEPVISATAQVAQQHQKS